MKILISFSVVSHMKSVCVEKQLFIALEITTTYLTMNEYKDPIREIGVYSENISKQWILGSS